MKVDPQAQAAMDEAWKRVRFVHEIKDTVEARRAFFAGAMHVLIAMNDALSSDEKLLKTSLTINHGLRAFIADTNRRNHT